MTVPEGFVVKSFATSNSEQPIEKSDYNLTTGKLTYEEANLLDNIPGDTYYDVVITVPANVTGTHTIDFSDVVVAYDEGFETYVEVDTVTATITVTEPEVEKTGYEVYYVLKDADGNVVNGDADKFSHFGVNDTIKAEIFMASYSGKMTLQAYDIYLTYSDALVYQSEAMEGTAYVAGAAYDEEAVDGEKISHITLVDGKTTIALSSEPVSLGTVTFAINGDTTVNGEQLAITLTEAEDTNANGGKQENVTNFSVGTDAAGNKESYYPTVGGDVLGVKVDQTWTVTWSGTNEVDSDVGHGTSPEFNATEPSKDADEQYTYKFKGWSLTEDPVLDAEVVDLEEYAVRKDTTFYPVFEIDKTNSYTVTFDMGGHGENKTEIVEYGTKVTRPEDPTADHYNFVDWYADSDFATEFNFGNAITTDTTIYAKWEAKTYTITFHPNGATGNTYTQEIPYGTTTALTENTFEAPEGQFFLNWDTAADGSGVTYGDKADITLTGDIDLYAQWSNASYTVISKTEGVTVDKSAADFEETVTVDVKAPAGYAIGTVTYIYTLDGQDKTETITAVNGVYSFKMPAANVTVSATFTPNTDTKYEVEHYQQNLDGTYGDPFETDELKGTTDTEVTPAVKNYPGFTSPNTQKEIIKGDGSTVVKYYYTRNTDTPYVVKHWQQNIGGGPDQNAENFTLKDTENLTGMTGAEVTPDVKKYDGYDAPVTQTVTIAADGSTIVNYYYTLGVYEVVLDANGGTLPEGEDKLQYTFGTGAALPEPTKPGHTFGGWYTEDGEGPITQIDANDFGDLNLIAKWEVDFDHAVEAYAYALEGYVMLRITAGSNENAYKLGEYEMYYTDTEEYKLNDAAVFVTLIPTSMVEENDEGKWVLTDAAMNQLTETGAAAKTIDRDGDVNGDGVTNIADANIVYQMLEHTAGAGYYNDLEILDRLEADVCTSLDQAVNRASTLDVHWIVNLINGVSNTESTN